MSGQRVVRKTMSGFYLAEPATNGGLPQGTPADPCGHPAHAEIVHEGLGVTTSLRGDEYWDWVRAKTEEHR